MKTHRICAIAAAGVIAGSAFLSGLTSAQQVSTVVDADLRNIRLAQESQKRVDKIVSDTRTLADQYRTVLKELEGLKVYNQLLTKQVANQQQEVEELNDSIDKVTVIERQIRPLMLRMIDGLEQFIALDVPFLKEKRAERVEFLKELMERSDVTVAEQFRRVLEAFQRENEYGRTIEAYEGELKTESGIREVDFLRIGRIALLYQTKDASETGAWDQATGDWVEVGAEYRNQVKQGLRMARNQIAPDLLLLPVPPAEGS